MVPQLGFLSGIYCLEGMTCAAIENEDTYGRRSKKINSNQPDLVIVTEISV